MPAAGQLHCGSRASQTARLSRMGLLGQARAVVWRSSSALLIVGLAPGAHGSNRTGRPFTGDRSGEILYRVLHQTGFASQAESVSRDDGLVLTGAYITAAVRCAPPDNKPATDEIRRCRGYLERELDLLPEPTRGGGARQSRLRRVSIDSARSRRDREPHAIPLRAQPGIRLWTRPAQADRVVSSQPAKHLNRKIRVSAFMPRLRSRLERQQAN